MAALCCEMSRQSQAVRERFTAGVRGMIGLLSDRMGSGLKQRQREEKALATIASLVGALVLARAVNDPKLSDDILRATKKKAGALNGAEGLTESDLLRLLPTLGNSDERLPSFVPMRARVVPVCYDAPYDSPDENRTRCDQARVRHDIRVDFSRIIRSRSRWHQLRRKYRRIRCGNRDDHPTSWFCEVSGGCSDDRIRRILPVVQPDQRWAKRKVRFRLG